jgi:hypothetical protein
MPEEAGARPPSGLPPPFAVLPARAVIWPLDPATYERHPFHRQDTGRVWQETNCYVDLWLELLWAARVEVAPSLAFTLAADFEGDQWTFFKFPVGDLQRLYGLDTQELSIWYAPHLHVLEQVHRGRIPLVEMDSFFLPDTKGTAYKHEHIKTTVGVQEIDLERRRLGYFHNSGYYVAEGDDFAGLFRLEDPWTPASLRLLPYTEFVKLDGLQRRPAAELVTEALALARGHHARRPKTNPFVSYKPRFASDLEWLRSMPVEEFHRYAFVSIRQFGANFELAADFCRWLEENGRPAFAAPGKEFRAIAEDAKALQFKIARAVTLKKPFDPAAFLDGLAARWDAAMAGLGPALAK